MINFFLSPFSDSNSPKSPGLFPPKSPKSPFSLPKSPKINSSIETSSFLDGSPKDNVEIPMQVVKMPPICTKRRKDKFEPNLFMDSINVTPSTDENSKKQSFSPRHFHLQEKLLPKTVKQHSSTNNMLKKIQQNQGVFGSLPNIYVNDGKSKKQKKEKISPTIANIKPQQDISSFEELCCPNFKQFKEEEKSASLLVLNADVNAFQIMMGFFEPLPFLEFLKGLKSCLKKRIIRFEETQHIYDDQSLENYIWSRKEIYAEIQKRVDAMNWIIQLNKSYPPVRRYSELYCDGLTRISGKMCKDDDVEIIFCLKCVFYFVKSQIRLIKRANLFDPKEMKSPNEIKPRRKLPMFLPRIEKKFGEQETNDEIFTPLHPFQIFHS